MTHPDPNTNCLAGFACPECGAWDRFRIDATAIFEVTDDGTDDYSHVEWNEASQCWCSHCDFDGTVADFRSGEATP